MCFCFVLICTNMSQTSEYEQAEQIWSGWSKFGVGGANLVWVEQIWSEWSKFGVGGADVGRTVWRVADNLEKTLLCQLFFLWAKLKKVYINNIEP